MLIEIKQDIFSNNDFRSLNYLLQIITYKNRYDLWVELGKVRGSSLYDRLDNEDKAIIEAKYNQQITEQTNQISPRYIVSNHNATNNWPLTIEEAIRFL